MLRQRWDCGPIGGRSANGRGRGCSCACHACTMIGRLHHVVLDCPDPAALAAFYSRLLGQPITYQSDDWVVVAANDASSGLAFQLAPGHRRPSWPDNAVPQQLHLEIMVEDVAASAPLVLAL